MNKKYVLVDYFDIGNTELEVTLVGEKTIPEAVKWLSDHISSVRDDPEMTIKVTKELRIHQICTIYNHDFVLSENVPPAIRKKGWTVTKAEVTEGFEIECFTSLEEAMVHAKKVRGEEDDLFLTCVVLNKWTKGRTEEIEIESSESSSGEESSS
jgi:hypothetical protein